MNRQLEPDYANVYQELKRPGVTLMLLWEEYLRGLAAVGQPSNKYASFCVKYRLWAASLMRSMRLTHLADGEHLFVDYAGQTVAVVDSAAGEIWQALVFVAVPGAWNYTYPCATRQQTGADWIGAIVIVLSVPFF